MNGRAKFVESDGVAGTGYLVVQPASTDMFCLQQTEQLGALDLFHEDRACPEEIHKFQVFVYPNISEYY